MEVLLLIWTGIKAALPYIPTVAIIVLTWMIWNATNQSATATNRIADLTERSQEIMELNWKREKRRTAWFFHRIFSYRTHLSALYDLIVDPQEVFRDPKARAPFQDSITELSAGLRALADSPPAEIPGVVLGAVSEAEVELSFYAQKTFSDPNLLNDSGYETIRRALGKADALLEQAATGILVAVDESDREDLVAAGMSIADEMNKRFPIASVLSPEKIERTREGTGEAPDGF